MTYEAFLFLRGLLREHFTPHLNSYFLQFHDIYLLICVSFEIVNSNILLIEVSSNLVRIHFLVTALVVQDKDLLDFLHHAFDLIFHI